MFLGKPRGDPDDRHRFEARRIGQQLPKVQMVGPLELVLDQHPGARPNVLAQDVRAKRSDRPFLRLQLELYTEDLAKNGQVLFAREPRGEITRLAVPDVAELDAGKPAKGPIIRVAAAVSCATLVTKPERPGDITKSCRTGRTKGPVR